MNHSVIFTVLGCFCGVNSFGPLDISHGAAAQMGDTVISEGNH